MGTDWLVEAVWSRLCSVVRDLRLRKTLDFGLSLRPPQVGDDVFQFR
jgi:hypothetical protein